MTTAKHLAASRKPLLLERLHAGDMEALAESLSAVASAATCREEAADRIVQHLFQSLTSSSPGEPACALIRCFQTYPLSQLPEAKRALAARALGRQAQRTEVRCLTLLATRGMQPKWNCVEDSVGHQAIPLPTVDVILRAPMIARLLLDMGIRFEHVVAPPGKDAGFMIEAEQQGLNIFHVPKALGSPHIPAQASFIQPYGVKSVVGLGGLLPGGELFAVVFFSRVSITRATAELFRPLTSRIQTALTAFPSSRTFFQPANEA